MLLVRSPQQDLLALGADLLYGVSPHPVCLTPCSTNSCWSCGADGFGGRLYQAGGHEQLPYLRCGGDERGACQAGATGHAGAALVSHLD